MPDLRFPAGVLLAAALSLAALPTRAQEVAPAVVAPVPAATAPSALPEGWQHGVFAEIYVRGYADSDNDGIGDLRGLTDKLDYLKQLGVSGIWLMPITRSSDHDHGYQVEDFRDIEPAFGTLADFDEFLRQAHARGIGVIVDYVLNHAGTSHPLFQASASGNANPYRDWFVWSDEKPEGWKIFEHDPWHQKGEGYYFSQFSAGMADFNLKNPRTVAWHMDNLRFWLNRGVDGFRFDAVPHLVENGKDATRDQPESMALMRAAAAIVHAYPNRYIVCEATHEEKRWASDEACGGAFAMGMAPNWAKAAKGDAKAITELGDFFAGTPSGMASMVSNHDLFAGERLWNQVEGDVAAYELAAAAYLLAPATPFVYYGEEIGMASAPGLDGDARLRTPMSWSANGFGSHKPFRVLSGNAAAQNLRKESARSDSLLAWYRALIHLRSASAVLQQGRFEKSWQWDGGWGYSRDVGGRRMFVLFNISDKPSRMYFAGFGNAQCIRAFPESEKPAQAASAPFTIPAHSVAVYDCK